VHRIVGAAMLATSIVIALRALRLAGVLADDEFTSYVTPQKGRALA